MNEENKKVIADRKAALLEEKDRLKKHFENDKAECDQTILIYFLVYSTIYFLSLMFFSLFAATGEYERELVYIALPIFFCLSLVYIILQAKLHLSFKKKTRKLDILIEEYEELENN